jgi:XRE family transcriptional regulator of biofilm formation
MTAESFSDKVRRRRLEEGLSQEELANRVGISRNYLSEIERGVATNLSWQVMERLTTELGLRAEQEPNEETRLAQLPPGLAEYAASANLARDDVLMLARLEYRGRQPTTPEQWEALYKVIKAIIGE